MGERLILSPLVEALCEFKFAAPQGGGWDLTIPGRLYDQIKDEFSVTSQVTEVGLHLQPSTPSNPSWHQAVTEVQRSQLKRPDASAMVQVGPNLLVVNHLQPYQSWNVFCSLIVKIFREYIGLLDSFTLERIGLRYINNVPVPEEPFEVSDFLTTKPNLVNSIDLPISFFHQRYDLLYEKLFAVLVHQSAIVQKPSGESVIVLDLDFNSNSVESFKHPDEVKKWLDEAHSHISCAFVDSLNDKFYQSLK
jgi:uncharacterized protein (TIGR04255 family)